MKQFLIDKFKYDLHANLGMVQSIEYNANDYILNLYSHILNAQETWNKRILGQNSDFEVWDLHDINRFHNLTISLHNDTLKILEKVDMDKEIEYKTTIGQSYSNYVVDIFFHLLNHSNYHRGQIARELRTEFDVTPPDTNFITYKR